MRAREGRAPRRSQRARAVPPTAHPSLSEATRTNLRQFRCKAQRTTSTVQNSVPPKIPGTLQPLDDRRPHDSSTKKSRRRSRPRDIYWCSVITVVRTLCIPVNKLDFTRLLTTQDNTPSLSEACAQACDGELHGKPASHKPNPVPTSKKMKPRRVPVPVQFTLPVYCLLL